MKRLIVTVSVIAVLSACSGGTESSDDPESPKPSATPTEPQTLKGARAVAKESAARFGAQDFGGSWDQWNTAGKDAIPRDEYVKYAEACNLGGAPLKIDDIRMEGDTKAVVRYEFAGFKQARTLIYEDGRWRAKVTNETLGYFKDGKAKGAIAAAKADGGCTG